MTGASSLRRRIGRLPALTAVFALCWASAARAQFTGPAFESTSPPNAYPTPTADPALLNPAQTDIRVDAGDILTVKIFGVIDYAPPVRVGQDGTVQLPLIGKLPLAGSTLHQAEDRIAQRLIEDGMYRNPQVTVQLSDYSNKFATVTGEIHGIVPILGERRLYDVLAAAAGTGGSGLPTLPVTASRVVTILRPGLEKPIVVDLGMDATQSAAANIPIFAHDTIVIAHVGVVYVVGAFKTQGAIPLNQASPLTLMQATALSGGAGFEGRMSDLHILRYNGASRTDITVNVGKVFRNRIPDPVLQAGDIVFLPPSNFKAALKANGISSFASLADLLIIALQYH